MRLNSIHRAKAFSTNIGTSSGRFVGRDPIEYDAGDLNLYRYTGNSPTNKTDPNGEEPFTVCCAIGIGIGILIGLSGCSKPPSCETAFEEALKDPEYQKIVKAIEKAGCKAPVPKCHKGGTYAGINDKEPKGIYISDQYTSTSDVTESLIHEAIHLLDDCRAPKMWSDCDKRACSEIRAYLIAGSCKKGGKHNRDGKMTEEGCIKKYAASSTAVDKKCGNGKTHVNNMYKKCAKTTL